MSDLFKSLAALSQVDADKAKLAGSDIMAKAQYKMDISILTSERSSIGSKKDAAQWMLTNLHATTEDKILAHETLMLLNGECHCEALRHLNVQRIQEMQYLEDRSREFAINRFSRMVFCHDCADGAGYEGDKLHDQLAETKSDRAYAETQADEEMRRREGNEK